MKKDKIIKLVRFSLIVFFLLFMGMEDYCGEKEYPQKEGSNIFFEFEQNDYISFYPEELFGIYSKFIKILEGREKGKFLELRGDASLKMGKLIQASIDYKEARTFFPKDSRIFSKWTQTLPSNVAIKELEKKLLEKPDCPYCMLALAKRFLEIGEPRKGLEFSSKLLKITKNLPEVYYIRALCFGKMGKIKNSLKECQMGESIALSKEDILTYKGLLVIEGNILIKLGQIKKALKAFRLAGYEFINPGLAYSGTFLGYFLSGKYNLSFLQIEKTKGKYRDFYILEILNLIAFNKLKKAEKICLEQGEKNPLDFHILWCRGLIELEKGQYNKSLEFMEKALKKVNPENSFKIIIQFSLAYIYSSCPDEKIRDGEKALSFALEISKKDEGENPLVLMLLSSSYASCKKFKIAREVLEKLLKNVTDDFYLREECEKRLEKFRQNRVYIFQPGKKFKDYILGLF